MKNDPYITSSDAYADGFKYGQILSAAEHGLTGGDAFRKEAAVGLIESDEAAQKMICRVGSYIFKQAGMTDSFASKAFDVIGDIEGPIMKVAADMFLTPVVESLAAFSKEVTETGIDKAASHIAAEIPEVIGKVLGAGKEATRLSLMGAGGVGLGLGGLLWALNRSAMQDDADITAKEEQARHYRQIARDIEKRVQLEQDKSEATKDIKKSIGDSSPDAYLL